MARADYVIIDTSWRPEARRLTFIVDLDAGGVSVTNDAEAVWAEVQARSPGNRLIYRDSMGRWDEIVPLDDGAVTFKPYHGDRPVVEPCEVCKTPINRRCRCTNGRCDQCHRDYCTPGGATEPGHGRRWPE